jgi:hypothetical protein
MRCTISFPLACLLETFPCRQTTVGEISLPSFLFVCLLRFALASQFPTGQKNKPNRPVGKRERGGNSAYSIVRTAQGCHAAGAQPCSETAHQYA